MFARSPSWASFENIVGGIILTLGIAGEILFGRKASSLEKRLRAEANVEIERLRSRGAEAEERVANLHLELADARERQANAELTIDALRKNQVPRWSTLDTMKFFAVLRSRTKGNAEIMYMAGDAEAVTFAAVLLACLKSVGWTAAETKPLPPWTPEQLAKTVLLFGPPYRIHQLSVIGSSEASDSPYTALLDAFKECDFFVARGIFPGAEEGTVRIYIGPKAEVWPMTQPPLHSPP